MVDALLRVEVCGGIWDVTPRGLWQQAHPSLLRRCAGSVVRRRRTPDPSRRDHTTHAGYGVCHRPQPSSAAVSAALRSWSRGHPLRAAFVLTKSKTKERQISTVRGSNATKYLCSKEFRRPMFFAPSESRRKFGGNRWMCHGVDCAHLNDL